MKIYIILWVLLGLVVGFNAPLVCQAEDASVIAAASSGVSVQAAQGMPIKGRVQTTEGKYRVAPGDTISISVHGAPEFDQTDVIIRPDGFMTVKPIGELDVAGMDIDGLSTLIEEQLSRYLVSPQVALSITSFHPAMVYVLGAVQKPGSYEVHGDIDRPTNTNTVLARGRLTVTNLIANAGGITQMADISHVTIKNNTTGEKRVVDLMQLLKEGDTTQDAIVHSGDTVFVPESAGVAMDDATLKLLSQSSLSPDTMTVRVLGEVTTPGVYNLPARSSGVNSALASAQGYTLDAQPEEVTILRMGQGNKLDKIVVRPKQEDFLLRDNDIVVVNERSVPIAGRAWDFTDRFIRPFLTLGNFTNSVLDIFDPGRRFPFANNR